jgi:hypothetical protein
VGFERTFTTPHPPPRATAWPALHHQTYSRDIERDWFRHWRLERLYANWVALPFPELSSKTLTASRVWARTVASVVGPSGPAPRHFGLRLRLTGTGGSPLMDLLKPLLDGVISAFHQYEGPLPSALVERIAASTGCEPEATFERLLSAHQGVLGSRTVARLTQHGVKWDPRDEDCVACVVTADPDGPPSMSGELFSVVVADSTQAAMVAMVPPQHLWSNAEWEAIRRGSRPRAGEDYWWVVTAGSVVRVHRTPTGLMIFEAEFTPRAGGWAITDAWVRERASDPGDAILLLDIMTTVLQGAGDFSKGI